MLEWLINGGYLHVFRWCGFLTVLLLALSVHPLFKNWRVWDCAAVCFVLSVSLMSAFSRPAAPNVYNDEFFYASIASRAVSEGVVCPFVPSGISSAAEAFSWFKPPYPQGWSCLIADFSHFVSLCGIESGTMWERAVLLNRLLLSAVPVLIFAGLRSLSGRIAAFVCAVSCVFLPFIVRLSSGGSAEPSALFCGCLFFLSVLCLAERPNLISWLSAAMSAALFGHFRPETALAAGLLTVLCLFFSPEFRRMCLADAEIMPRLLRGYVGPLAVACVIFSVFWWPAAVAVICHPADLSHHFEALPRGSFTMWANRLANLRCDTVYWFENLLWPFPLTAAALAGTAAAFGWLGLKTGRASEVKLSMLWLVLFTVFLAWFPFGDYTSTYSLDSWRFAYLAVIPMLTAAAAGIEMLWNRSRSGRAAVAVIVLSALVPWASGRGNFLHADAGWDAMIGRAAVMAAKVNAPVLVEDEPSSCIVSARWGAESLLMSPAEFAVMQRRLQNGTLSTAGMSDACRRMLAAPYIVACLSYDEVYGGYFLAPWSGRKIHFLEASSIEKNGLFLMERP